MRFVTTSDGEGRYQFQPLPPGRYKITVSWGASYQADDSEIDLHSGDCWSLALTRSPHARVSGYVRRSDRSPIANLDLVIISADNEWYETEQTDQSGRFTFESLKPGKYVIGLNFPPRSNWISGSGAGESLQLPPASLFYPGVINRGSASVIQIAADQKLDEMIASMMRTVRSTREARI